MKTIFMMLTFFAFNVSAGVEKLRIEYIDKLRKKIFVR